MKDLIRRLTNTFPEATLFHLSVLIFRVAVSIELMLAHGMKKIGIGVQVAEHVPNPLHLPGVLNEWFAIAGNLIFPVFVIVGLFTRLAILPILAITLTGYFVVHLHESILEKDTPFMYSVVFLLILFIGPGKYSIDSLLHRSPITGRN
jgi:putative oxidoreductase